MALVMFVLQAISIPFIKERMPPSKGGIRVFDLRALREWRFGLHCAGAFFSAFGEYYALSSGFFSSICFILIFARKSGGDRLSRARRFHFRTAIHSLNSHPFQIINTCGYS